MANQAEQPLNRQVPAHPACPCRRQAREELDRLKYPRWYFQGVCLLFASRAAFNDFVRSEASEIEQTMRPEGVREIEQDVKEMLNKEGGNVYMLLPESGWMCFHPSLLDL